MSYNLVINSSNVVNSLNNQYRYDFINGSFEIPENAEIMISSLQIPYSWYNISTRSVSYTHLTLPTILRV